MESIQATVGILTFNSECTLERALKSVAEFAEILVCDGGSTDRTRDIAERFGARVIDQPQKGPIEDYSKVRNHLLSASFHDWFLQIDADETASSELVRQIRQVVQKNNEPFVWRIPEGLMYREREIVYYSSFPGYQHRFFSKKSGASYVKPIHERIDFPKQNIGTLTGKWFVYWDEEEEKSSGVTEHLKADAAFTAKQPLGSFLYYKVWRNLLGIVYIMLYTLRARTFHPWKKCAPCRAEWKKIIYKARHIVYAFRYRYHT